MVLALGAENRCGKHELNAAGAAAESSCCQAGAAGRDGALRRGRAWRQRVAAPLGSFLGVAARSASLQLTAGVAGRPQQRPWAAPVVRRAGPVEMLEGAGLLCAGGRWWPLLAGHCSRSPAPVRSRSMDCERKMFISPRFAFGAMVLQGRQSGTETVRCGVD